MLKPALLYTREITRKFTEHLYTTDYYYYCGYYCGSSLPKIEEEEDLYPKLFTPSPGNRPNTGKTLIKSKNGLSPKR